MNNVLVTGAAGDIGTEIFEQAKMEGYEVIATDINGSDRIQALDITDPDSISDFFAQFTSDESFPDILVNNAGVYLGKDVTKYSHDELSQVIQVNIFGTILVTQAFVNGIMAREKEGKVINISSIAGIEGGSDAVYAASKAALLGFTKSLPNDITSYCIAPGLVEGTKMESTVPIEKLDDYSDSSVTTRGVAFQIMTLIGGNHEYKNGEIIEYYNDNNS